MWWVYVVVLCCAYLLSKEICIKYCGRHWLNKYHSWIEPMSLWLWMDNRYLHVQNWRQLQQWGLCTASEYVHQENNSLLWRAILCKGLCWVMIICFALSQFQEGFTSRDQVAGSNPCINWKSKWKVATIWLYLHQWRLVNKALTTSSVT